MTIQRRNKHSLLALAVAGALVIPLGASAQSEREAALEARVAELERLVMELAKQQAAAPAAPTPAAPPAPGAAPPPPPVQAVTIVPGANPGTRFGFGGFIKSNFMQTDYDGANPAAGNVARDFYLPGAVPVGGQDESAVFDAHAKQSRFWLTTDTALDNGHVLSSRFEMDFAVPVSGDERNTNTYNPVLRRAYLTYDKWLFGQEWSNFMDLVSLAETTDFLGPAEGMVFVRQPQIRYTSGAWSFSVENPETTSLPFGGGARIVTDDNTIPDFTAKYTHKAAWGQLSLAGVLRQLRYDNAGASTTDSAFGLSLAGKVMLGADDVRFLLTTGSGIGRYVGLNFFEDAVLDAGGDLDALDMTAGYVSYRHVWSGSVRSNLTYGFAKVDNDAALTGMSANAKANSLRANLFWSPVPKLDFGVEVSTVERELESGADGGFNRLDFMAKYSF